jgi:asparagine synthase (glutamine-hydrolysing)
VIHRDGRSAALETVKAMTDAVAHRGPNGEGHVLERSVGLGHRRLSVLDLSEHGHQPMDYGKTGLTLTFNGEIYNSIELREELAGFGYTFNSDTDSEVILAAYDRWGVDCVERFNGMWAFAIWDAARTSFFFRVTGSALSRSITWRMAPSSPSARKSGNCCPSCPPGR